MAQRQKVPTEFQVRIHILEARNLVGGDLLNPAVKVACGKDHRQTTTKKGTQDPVFNEVSVDKKTL